MFGLLCYCCRSFCFVVFVGAWFVVLLLLTFGLLCFNLLFLFGLLYCWAFVHCCVAVLFLLSCSTVFVWFGLLFFPWLCYCWCCCCCCCCCCWLLICCLVAVIDVLFVQCVSIIASVNGLVLRLSFGLSCRSWWVWCVIVVVTVAEVWFAVLSLVLTFLVHEWGFGAFNFNQICYVLGNKSD